jgi:hypothetical protein
MSVEQVRGREADWSVQATMNYALADILSALGFRVEAFGGATAHMVHAVTR